MNVTQNEEDIFIAALEIELLQERADYLDDACGENAQLRSRIEALLNRHQESAGMLDAPPPGIDATEHLEVISEKPGDVIGTYKLREEIGVGGFGVVFLAEQERPVKRKVALKIIKPGMDTRQVIARFEAERQALAMMDHPNIARVYDAGSTASGRPYFVMELVHGVPITEYCDQCNLTTRERLELFISVCQAVQHAHQKGVIHRDIKPTNVLVAMQDGRPAPKIIDFGVAKAINQRLTEHTLATGYAQMIGTPLYMSPEQAELSPLGADTRSDIYSLGVLLYELLTGTIPLDMDRLHAASYDELRRIIREEEPPRPSARLSTLAAKLATTVAERRRTDPDRLRQTVRGELDWIVMKCLEKDRNRRYDTASSLGRDIERYLGDEPVQACPPSAAYRLQKFARRNRAVLVSAGLVAAALVVGVAVSISQAVRATRAESLATARLKDATEARANAEASSQKARLAVDDMYTQVAEKWLAHQPQMESIQREFLEKALQFYTEFAKETSNDPSVRYETARAYRRIAEIQHRLGQPAPAEVAFKRAIDHMQSLVDEVPTKSAYRAELAATLHKLGVLLGDTGRYLDEEKIHRRALTLEEQLAAADSSNTGYRPAPGSGHWFVAEVFSSLHRREEAIPAYHSALAIQHPLVADFPSVAEYREHLAESLFGLGNAARLMGATKEYEHALGEAADLFEQLAAEFPSIPQYRNQLANVYYWRMKGPPRGRPETYPKEAEQYLRRALALQQKLADDFPAVADYRYDLLRSYKTLGWVLSRASRREEAETALRQAAAIADRLVADSPSVHYYQGTLAQTYSFLGQILIESGRLREGEDAYRQSISLLESLVADFPEVRKYWSNLSDNYCRLGSLLRTAGRSDEAAAFYRKALQLDPRDSIALRGIAELQSSTQSEAVEQKIIGAGNATSTSPSTTDN
ncbi:MAG: protein kinase [Pirellulales bacterium]